MKGTTYGEGRANVLPFLHKSVTFHWSWSEGRLACLGRGPRLETRIELRTAVSASLNYEVVIIRFFCEIYSILLLQTFSEAI